MKCYINTVLHCYFECIIYKQTLKTTINFEKDRKKEDQRARKLTGRREYITGKTRETEGKKIKEGEGRGRKNRYK